MRRNGINPFWLWTGLVSVAFILLALPPYVGATLRSRTLSAMRPLFLMTKDLGQNFHPTRLVRQVFSSQDDEETLSISERGELEALRQRNAKLISSLLKTRDSNKRLGEQLKAPPPTLDPSVSGVAAQVIQQTSLWNDPVLGLDRGAIDGIKLHAGVLYCGAVMGRIISVGPKASHMALLTHPRIRISARLIDCRATGMLEGLAETTQTGLCRMTIIAKTLNVKTGEQVVTSGFDGSFPSGCWLGQVVSATQTHTMKWDVLVQPACGQQGIEAVYVLTESDNE